jgi:hypothetical protein
LGTPRSAWAAAAFYTDKAALFQTAQKHRRDEPGVEKDGADLPPTQIGRAWQELSIVWIPAHSPQAKGRVERGFSTAPDRLVKGLRVAGANSLEQAHMYLEREFLPWWNRRLAVEPKSDGDAHRALTRQYDWAAILSPVEPRQISHGYTVRYRGQAYQIPASEVRTGMRGSQLRVEARLDGSIAMRFNDEYGRLQLWEEPQRVAKPHTPPRPVARAASRKSRWREGFFDKPAPTLRQALGIANATS